MTAWSLMYRLKNMAFSLEKFESLAYGRSREMGVRELLALLQDLDANYGQVGAQFKAQPLQSVGQQDMDLHVLNRVAAAASCLLSDPDLFFDPVWQPILLSHHRWLASLFAATPFRNADHVMRALNLNEGDKKSDLHQLQIGADDLLKFCLLYSPESEVPLDLDALWAANKVLAAGLCLVLLSPRFLGSQAAHAKREQILPWLSQCLDKIDDIEQLPLGVLHDLYMHCSYADRADKHDIKKPINALIRRKLQQHGLKNSTQHVKLGGTKKTKPVMMVVLEWFTSAHSIYRTHSLTLEAAREKFHLVAMAYDNCTDAQTRQVFHEVVAIPREASMLDQLQLIQKEAKNRKASVFYMPSVGMFPLTMWLANLRMAPLQVMGLGHPATSHSDVIDYVVVEEDYVGDPACFSEKLLLLPSDGMPYRPSASATGVNVMRPPRASADVVQVAMCATTMKLNPEFLQACAEILRRSSVPLHFHFLIGQAQGLTFPHVHKVISQYLGEHVTVYPHQPYVPYMQVIGACDMFINPFPFGNTNGIIDTISAGLVGVCKSGNEVHEHIDEGLFRRLGMPDWLIARTTEEYILATLRLAANHTERAWLRNRLSSPEKVKVLFKGRPEIMSERLLECLTHS